MEIGSTTNERHATAIRYFVTVTSPSIPSTSCGGQAYR